MSYLCIILDVDPQEALYRIIERESQLDRLEKSIDLKLIADRYRRISCAYGSTVVDGNGSIEEVSKNIINLYEVNAKRNKHLC